MSDPGRRNPPPDFIFSSDVRPTSKGRTFMFDEALEDSPDVTLADIGRRLAARGVGRVGE
jgi:hypothetical protein